MPFIDTVIYIDKRILDIESPAQEVIASSQDKEVRGSPKSPKLASASWSMPSRVIALPIR